MSQHIADSCGRRSRDASDLVHADRARTAHAVTAELATARQQLGRIDQPDGRRPLLQTGTGTRTGAFGTQEWLLLAGASLIWGSSFLLIDIGLQALQPGLIALARVGLDAAALAATPAARRSIDRQDRPRVALLGLVWVGVPLPLFPVAQQWIDSSVAGMLNGAVPLAGAAWAVLLGRPLARAHAAGLLVGFAGILAISWPQLGGSRATMVGSAWSWVRWCCTAWPSTWPCRCTSATAPSRCCCAPSWPRWRCWRRSGSGACPACGSPGDRPWPCCRSGSWAPVLPLCS